nr:hypothetical protein [Tanacetum cinerariifolium]
PLYVQDVLTDEKLIECSAAAHGVYFLLLCILHKQKEYGVLLLKQKDKQTDNQILNFACKLVKPLPFTLPVIESALTELITEEVLQIDGDRLVQNRMMKDGIISDKRSSAGKQGGKATQSKLNFDILKDDFAKAKLQANSEAKNKQITEYEIENEYDILEDLNIKKKEEEKIEKLTNVLVAEWNFTELKDKEIMIAFQNGATGDYGKYFGLNVVYFTMFLTEYINHTDRLEAVRLINTPEVVHTPIPTPEDMFKTAVFNSCLGYSNFIKHGTTDHYGSVIYDFLFSINFFTITQEEIDECFKRANTLYFANLKEKKASQKDVLRRKEVENQIKSFLDKISTETEHKDNGNPIVISLAKRCFIDDLYQSFQFEEVSILDLQNMINDKRDNFKA